MFLMTSTKLTKIFTNFISVTTKAIVRWLKIYLYHQEFVLHFHRCLSGKKSLVLYVNLFLPSIYHIGSDHTPYVSIFFIDIPIFSFCADNYQITTFHSIASPNFWCFPIKSTIALIFSKTFRSFQA